MHVVALNAVIGVACEDVSTFIKTLGGTIALFQISNYFR